jgi:ketosteroid isomerase-like protein
MPIDLPEPIARFVAANARLDVDAMVEPFAADAIVLDNGSRHEGHAGLRTLLEEAVIPVKAIFTPDAVRHENGRIVVEGPAHGFTYDFTLEDDAIKTLEITL